MSQVIKSLASGPVPPTVATSYVTNSGTATPSANILNVIGGAGATTTGSGNTITVTVSNEGFAWTETSTNFNIPIENGVFANAGLTIFLPAIPALVLGNTVIIYVDTTSTVTIQSNTGQMIQVGNSVSVPGGVAVSNTKGSILELIFKPSDLTWHTQSSLGSWSVT
jgi:hypothetical protein